MINPQVCENCGKTYDEGRSLEEAWEEDQKLRPVMTLENRVLVCWDCSGLWDTIRPILEDGKDE